MTFVAIIMTYLKVTDKVSDFSFMVFEMINDLYKISYIVPAILGIGAFIIYKCKTFTMTEACTNCACSVENFQEIHRKFHNEQCYFMAPGDHSDECIEFPKFGSYCLKDYCVACSKDACNGQCSHALPIESVDPRKLNFYKNWFSVHVHTASDITPDVFSTAGTILTYREEESPKGERMTKSKRILRQEESPKGERQTVTKRQFNSNWRKPLVEEESPKGERMIKTKRTLYQEESPKAERMTKTKRTLNQEGHSRSSTPVFSPPTQPQIADWLATPQELSEEYDFGGHNPGSEQQDKIKIVKIASGVEQHALDCGSRDLFSAIVKTTLKCKRSVGTKSYTLHGHPFGKYVTTPAHLHTSADPSATYSFETIINGKSVDIPMTLVGKKESRDVAVWEFVDKRVLFSQRFYNNLISDDEYLKFANEKIYVLQHLPVLSLCQLVTASAVNHKQICLQKTGVKLYEKLYEVQATSTLAPVTAAGDCGGVLVAFNTAIKKKIIGFHVVGAEDRAFSAIVTRDLIDSIIPVVAREEFSEMIIDQKFSKFPIVDTMNQIQDVLIPTSNLPDGNFEYLGELTYLARPAASTGIKKHPLHGSFEVKHAPAHLSTNEVEDKSTLRLDAHGQPNLLITRTEKYGKYFKNIIDPTIL
jgi:hypothetical protein